MYDSTFTTRFLQRVIGIITILALLLGGGAPLTAAAKVSQPPAVPLQAVSTLHLDVISADDSDTYGVAKGDPIADFKYIINIDNTGTTEQRSPAGGCSPADSGYPDSCNWVSVASRASHSPIYAQGNQDDFPGGDFTINGSMVDLPEGRYLISILADDFRIDGKHFTVPGSGEVTVQMQPYDLPTATIQAAVFEDMAPTNSAPDVPGERGLAGFRARINDYVDEVTTDVFGNPLGAEYDDTGEYIPGTGGVVLSKCYVVANGVDIGTVNPVDSFGRCPLAFTTDVDPLLSANITQTIEGDPIPVGAQVEGKAIIRNVGPNRYGLSVVPPNKSGWIQTTTLEGNHEWDSWVMEGATGLDTEFVVAGEPFPATFFGYVRPSVNIMDPGGDNTITGVGLAVSAYFPPTGGIAAAEGVRGAKAKDPNPIHRLFVSLSDLNAADQTVFVQEFPCDELAGCPAPEFTIPNVPDGDYVLGVWDEPQDYIFAVQQVVVRNGQTVDVGNIALLGWWTTFDGYVFYDLNEDGFRDPDEPGVPNFPIVMRSRENSILDRGTVAVSTDNSGYYWMESGYPFAQWVIMEAYADTFHTTGITFQADNQPTPTTIKGGGVDVNVLPVIGLGGRLDWGVKQYDPGENGGIVGTVSYDVTRNELNPQYAAIEDWQPSISDLYVNLYAPIACGTNPNTACDANGLYELAQDGSYALGRLLNQALTETWERPAGCTARNVDGNPLVNGLDENVLPLGSDVPGNDLPCLEAPMMGVQFGPIASDVGTPDENFGAPVDGNWGFGDGCYMLDGVTPGLFDPDTGDCAIGSLQALPSNRDYLVKVEVPDDEYGRPLYQVTREEDINVANGDSFVPQAPPPYCAGALHTVDVKDIGSDGYPAVDLFGNGSVVVPASSPVVNAPFVDMGGTIYEGLQKPLCDTKLVRLADKRSIAPGFNFFTEVPLPGRFYGLLVDDLNWSTNPQQTLYGEKMGIGFAPVGIYDYTNRLIATVESDYNGFYDVLLPSTNRINCPTPSGVCANMYRLVGNDPGVPGKWNANYTPQYRTISAEFEAWSGINIPVDLAPTQVAVSIQIPGTQTLTPIMCMLEATQPQLMAVSAPFVDVTAGDGTFTIQGYGFGLVEGQVFLDDLAMTTTTWSPGTIDVTVPQATSPGTHQLSIVASNGQKTVNGLTFHVLNTTPVSVSAFPTNPTALDTFNSPPSYNFNTNWSQNGSAYSVVNNGGINHDFLRIRAGEGTPTNAWLTNPTFGTSQEAYFTFVRPSGNIHANQQGLLLKYSGGADPNSLNARWISVTLDNNETTDQEDMTLVITTKSGTGPLANQFTELLNLESPNVLFSNGDQLGARALSNGVIIVYKNGSEITRVNSSTGGWQGQIGLRFEGTGGSSTEARIDDFGGGDTLYTSNAPYAPVLFEVGPGKPFSNIQSAIDAAAAQSTYQDSLVVVYPAAPDLSNPRYNGRGAYYENVIMYAPVQLQGVGPGGMRPDGTVVYGSLIDGTGYGGDTTLALNWLGKVGTLTWDGNQDINHGQVIYVLASDTGPGNTTVRPTLTEAGSFNSTAFKPMIDGFNIRGGDQQGLPGNLPEIFGGLPEGVAPTGVITQGGAIFANAYVRNLQITNNQIESNGGTYGAIRIGTPNLPAPDNDNQNDDLRIANNRILANGGTNLAGAIGLFNGAEDYEVAHNDLCGNFSAEYGGAISHFGLSPNGSIHDNRIYFNRSYDEGAGIMVAGELPTNPNANYGAPGGPQGSGSVEIYNNLIQANLADDDGGGIRFLMAGNFPMNVYNNMIVNNVSTHEGGGVAIDDASNVRFYNNTVMNNVTTATAVTSDGLPAPAGLATVLNSTALQATLPGSAPLFSDPLLFNNVFYNNWAGTNDLANTTVTGITPGDANPWDMGSIDPGILLSPTDSVLESSLGVNSDPSNTDVDPAVVAPLNIPMTFTNWRANVNLVTTLMVTVELPPSLLSDYHLFDNASSAYNLGAASKSSVSAPADDFDGDLRPGFGAFDSGADEIQGTAPVADLSITKTDIQTTVNPGAVIPYSILVSNAGPDAAFDAVVTDTVPAQLGSVTWLCSTSSGGAVCDAASGSGNNISLTVDLPAGSSVLVTVYGTLPGTATGSVVNTASVAAPATVNDPDLNNNSATDTDTILLPTLPHLTLLDNFNRTNVGTLNRSGVTASITVNTTSVTAAANTFSSTDVGLPISSNTVSGRTIPAGATITAVNGTGSVATISAAATGPVGTSSVAVTVSGWSQTTFTGLVCSLAGLPSPCAGIRVNSNQALGGPLGGQAMWNVPAAGFTSKQGAGFTFANTPAGGSALILKASGGSAAAPSTFIRVRYNGTQVIVETTTNGNTLIPSYTTIGTFAATFATNDTLTAVANADGSVDVWKNSIYLGRSGVSLFTGGGRIGVQLPPGARVDNFSGGTLP